MGREGVDGEGGALVFDDILERIVFCGLWVGVAGLAGAVFSELVVGDADDAIDAVDCLDHGAADPGVGVGGEPGVTFGLEAFDGMDEGDISFCDKFEKVSGVGFEGLGYTDDPFEV